MKDEREFNNAYFRLNTAQKEAVDTIDGPVMVIAGPGTGKTQILTLRIANILKQTDIPPDAILALTFTDAGVFAMRKRLATFIGAAAYRVQIFTFHGFCNEVIGRFSGHFPELVGSRPATELDQIVLMQKIFDDTKLEILASFRSRYHYVKKVISAISSLKREAISPEAFIGRLDEELKRIQSAPDYTHDKGAHKGKVRGEYKKIEESIVKNRELAIIYKKYEKRLAESELYDFDDMILTVVNKLETDEDLSLILQEEYQYVLADEHQDANGAQNKVLEFLSSFHNSPNLFIVGDDKQAIYRFQGASLENFRYFRDKFPSAKLIALEENYRSTQSVLDTAHKLITRLLPQGGQGDQSVRLLARSGHKENKILINEYETAEHEARELAIKIKELLAKGVKPEEIAIFTRTNAELAKYEDILIKNGVQIAVNTKKDALDDIDIEKLLIMIRAASKIGEDEWLIRALHLSCFKIPELDIYNLARTAAKKRISVWNLLEGSDEFMEIKNVADLIATWAKLGANIAPAELVSTIAKESGLLVEIITKEDAEDKLAMIANLLSYLNDFVKMNRGVRLPDLLGLLDTLDEYNVLETNLAGRTVGRVQMMTAHKSKGLEFDYVFIVGVTEGNWSGGRSHTDFKIPGLVSVTKEDEEADDRRLFYVALTRARKELVISYAKIKDGGSEASLSRFVDDLPEELISRQSFNDEADLAAQALNLSPRPATKVSPDEMKQFIRETLADRGLAVTGLNNYLKCPWQYFYRTLLRVPEPPTASSMFGTAIHGALRAYFDALALGEEMNKKDLLMRFENELARESLTDKDFEAALKEGREALTGYLDWYGGKFEKNVKNEFAVDVVYPVSDFDIRLTGKLDKIEFLSGSDVAVVDYKTGRIKTKNEIEGNTKDADGDYKRQLVFYNILLNRFKDGEMHMKSGIIDFVIPDDKGKYHRVEFEMAPEEVVEIENLIKKSVEEILNLTFWNARCEDKECQYCKLREMMI